MERPDPNPFPESMSIFPTPQEILSFVGNALVRLIRRTAETPEQTMHPEQRAYKSLYGDSMHYHSVTEDNEV